jgi:hypothetical protein
VFQELAKNQAVDWFQSAVRIDLYGRRQGH